MRKVAFILVLLFWALSTSAQSLRDTVRFISEIKRDSLYVYGDATRPTKAEARRQAFSDLSDEVRTRQGVSVDSSRINYLQHSRGNMTRVLAYVLLADLQQSIPEADNTEEMIRRLETLFGYVRNVPALEAALLETGLPKSTVAIVDGDTPGKILERSYILICREATILTVYSPADEEHARRLLPTGEKTNRIAYKKGDIIRWVYIENY